MMAQKAIRSYLLTPEQIIVGGPEHAARQMIKYEPLLRVLHDQLSEAWRDRLRRFWMTRKQWLQLKQERDPLIAESAQLSRRAVDLLRNADDQLSNTELGEIVQIFGQQMLDAFYDAYPDAERFYETSQII